jgi:hypothetical protein
MRMRALSWLTFTLAGVALWWLAAWGAYEGLLDIGPTLFAATGRLARDPTLLARLREGLDLLLELAQATVAALWILGTLGLLVGMAWVWRQRAGRRGWRLPYLG